MNALFISLKQEPQGKKTHRSRHFPKKQKTQKQIFSYMSRINGFIHQLEKSMGIMEIHGEIILIRFVDDNKLCHNK